MSEQAALDAFLLTRHWRDTQHGIELVFWLSSATGPLRVLYTACEAVCFVERDQPLPLPTDVRRKPVSLQLLHGGDVDAVYFRQQRQLNEFKSLGYPINESDIKPADRHLMERFITADVQLTGSSTAQRGYREMAGPRMSPTRYTPELTLMSLDIETNGYTGELYSIGAHLSRNATCNPEQAAPEMSCVFMIGGQQSSERRNGYRLQLVDNERALLIGFFDWLQQVDPDILIGWNIVNFDLDHLETRCRKAGLEFRMGRGSDTATVLQPSSEGQPKVARIPGRPVLDGVDLLKAGFWSFESFALDHVAAELLGDRKLITAEQNKVKEINRLFKQDKPALADYNFQDCRLVTEIFNHADLLHFAIERARLTGLALDRMGGSVAAFDHLYLPRLHRAGYVAPDLKPATGPGSPGGYVLDSVPGLYENVLLLDFKSLYPSIIRTFHIDPLGLAVPGDNPIEGFEGATFSRDKVILPGIIASLWQERDRAKAEQNAPLSQAIKIIMNSFYGVLGSSGCRFHQARLASSITRRGHEIILRTRDFLETRGYQVIYGDTDSVFVLLGSGVNDNEARDIGHQLMTALNDWWTTTLAQEHQVTSYLDVEFETHFRRFLMPTVRGMTTGSKKRYAGLVRSKEGDGHELVIKGLEAVRTDWTELARDFQRELFRRVFFEEPFSDYIRDVASRLLAGELDDKLVYRKRLRKKLSLYQRNVPPHVQAARKLDNPGNWVRYMITVSGPEPVEKQVSQPDYQHYLEKQLAPAANTVLHFLDTDFQRESSSQMQMF